MMRVTAGELKGLPFSVPAHLRATEGKVRQALFNILGGALAQARVVDGFAGSGSLGLEALSRGARFVVFLESHPVCLRVLRQNLSRIHASHWEILVGDVRRGLSTLAQRGEQFDLVLLDPPYEAGWEKKVLNEVADCAILAPAGILCLEHASRSEAPSHVGSLRLMKQHRYGGTVLSFYTNFAEQNLSSKK